MIRQLAVMTSIAIAVSTAALAQPVIDRAAREWWITLMNREAAEGWLLTGMSVDGSRVDMVHLPVISSQGRTLKVCAREDSIPTVPLGRPTQDYPKASATVLLIENIDCSAGTIRMLAASSERPTLLQSQHVVPGSLAEGLVKTVCGENLGLMESMEGHDQVRFTGRAWCRAHASS